MILKKKRSVVSRKAAALKKANDDFINSGALPQKVPVRLCVEGYPIDQHLAVTPVVSRKGKWHITERRTGRVLSSDTTFSTVSRAYACGLELSTLKIPWEKMSPTNREHNLKVAGHLVEKVAAILSQHAELEKNELKK
jgi:hypothetical protein